MAKASLQAPAAILLAAALAACEAEPPPSGVEPPRVRHGASERIASAVQSSHPFRAEMTRQGALVMPSRGSAWAFQATPHGFGCDGALEELGEATPAVRAGRT